MSSTSIISSDAKQLKYSPSSNTYNSMYYDKTTRQSYNHQQYDVTTYDSHKINHINTIQCIIVITIIIIINLLSVSIILVSFHTLLVVDALPHATTLFVSSIFSIVVVVMPLSFVMFIPRSDSLANLYSWLVNNLLPCLQQLLELSLSRKNFVVYP